MKQIYRIAEDSHTWYPLGLSLVSGGIHIAVADEGNSCTLLLFHGMEQIPFLRLDFSENSRRGNVWNMTVLGADFSDVFYCFEIDGKLKPDPCGREFKGGGQWGDFNFSDRCLKTPVVTEAFDWKGDRPLYLSYDQCIIYRTHVRGFTSHSSSGVKCKGTYKGIIEKIPYLKALGITALELLPVYEFQEVITPKCVEGSPYGVDNSLKKLNYWGYESGYYFAPKSAYGSSEELKLLVQSLHKEGIELIVELYFEKDENQALILDVVRHWVHEFHIDGIHLSGEIPKQLIGTDPYLSSVKLFATSWEGISGGKKKHLGEYNDGFMVDMRKVLKGDEDMMRHLLFRTKQNPEAYGIINYMANINGFTLMDLVSYDRKHNEENGEQNKDGAVYNYSWNCGIEGPSRKKKIVELRKKQIRNAILLLFLSQGTPLLLGGDEFGNSQKGNNNPYCQDNEISWLNWKLLKSNQDLFQFVQAAIQFRKVHPVLRNPNQLKEMDYLIYGQPDVSYHGVKVWCPQFEHYHRQLGILYCGSYGRHPDGREDDSIYVAYNMHWESHQFDLPKLPAKKRWHIAFNTDEGETNGICLDRLPVVEDGGNQFVIPPRTIVVFIGLS